MDETDLPRKSLFKGQFLELIREGHWEYAERINAKGAAAIVAVTDDGKMLLVEQYRIPCHARTVELPAGIIGDEPDLAAESHLEAARRELFEETGYVAGKIEPLIVGPPSAGLSPEMVAFFRATQLKRTGAGGGVAHEDIEVHEIPVNQFESWVAEKAQAGVLIDPKVYVGLHFVLQTFERGAFRPGPLST